MHRAEPFADIPDEPLLNIKAVSQATGVEPVTLRAWERRYGVPEPARSDQGYRLYSERDVAILRWLKAKVDAGVKIKQAVTMLQTQMPQSLPYPPRVGLVPATSTTLSAMVDDLLEAAHAFDSVAAQRVIAQAFALFPVEDVCLSLLVPVLEEIGAEWRRHDTSLQVEHFLSNTIRQQLLVLDAATPPPSRPERVLAGCGPGELHEMGVLILAMILRRRGWDVVYLGQAVGTDRLREAVEEIEPSVVVMAASSLHTLGRLAEAEEAVRGANGVNAHFVFGGTLFPYVPQLVERLPGIYGGDTLQEAAQRLESLLAGTWQPAPNLPAPTPADVARLHHSLRLAAPGLAERLAGLLVEADGELEPAAASAVAQEALQELLAALEFNMPELLDAPDLVTGPALTTRGVGCDDLTALLAGVVGEEALPALEPYLSRM